nr:G protein-coupled receptor [Proales similis]
MSCSTDYHQDWFIAFNCDFRTETDQNETWAIRKIIEEQCLSSPQALFFNSYSYAQREAPQFDPQPGKNFVLFKQITLHPNTCDQIFLNAFIDKLKIREAINSLVQQNSLGFIQSHTAQELNSFVGEFLLSGYRYDIDQRLFARSVFSRTLRLELEGLANSFSSEVLIDVSLSWILLNFIQMREFWHNNVKWLDCAHKRSAKQTLKIEILDNNLRFEYFTAQRNSLSNGSRPFFAPENFCIFQRIKAQKLNVRIQGYLIERTAQERCDCELLWLIDNLFRMRGDEKPENFNNFGECDRLRQQLAQSCDFDAITSRCENFSTSTDTWLYSPNIYDLVMRLRFGEFVDDILLGPIVNVCGFGANLLVVVVFGSIKRSSEYRQKKLTDKSRRMWDYVHINSAFMMVQSMISAVDVLTNCISYASLFCPSFFNTRLAHVFYLFGESYLGNCMRLMSNFTNTMFVLYRYSINMDRFEQVRKWRPRKVVAVAFSASALLSVIVVFINERYTIAVLTDSMLHVYNTHTDMIQIRTSTWKKVFYFMNLLLGNVLFTLLNLCLDAHLLFQLKRREIRKEQAELKVTKMIVFNGLFSFFFRLPEIVATFVKIFLDQNANRFYSPLIYQGFYSRISPFLSSLAKLLYSFSLLENLITLVCFNSTFSARIKSLLFRTDESRPSSDKEVSSLSTSQPN